MITQTTSNLLAENTRDVKDYIKQIHFSLRSETKK